MGILKTLVIKEIRQFRRNSFMPKLVVAMPLLLILVLPWITTMEVKDINVGVVDYDCSDVSRKIISKIEASEYFILEGFFGEYRSALNHLEQGKIDVILEIPAGFGKSIFGTPEKLSVWSNGVDAMKGALGGQYVAETVMRGVRDIIIENGVTLPESAVETTYFFNPTMDYKFYMIPALIIMIIVMLAGFLPALNLVIEKEIGTIEQINVTPVNRFVFTLSKLIPFWGICLLELAVCMILSRLVYGLEVAGSVWAILLASVLFIIVMSSVGVLLANLSNTMQQTMFLMLFIILSFILISGLMTPVESMPVWAQKISWCLPPTYMVDVMRAVYLKGATVSDLWVSYVALGAFAVLFCGLAVITYRKRN